MSITLPAFTPAQDSLFLTLGGRALDSRLPRPFLGDTMADEIITRIGYDLSKFPALTTKILDPRTRVFDIAVRAKRLDELVRRFVIHHPDAVVLDLGAGLDGRAAASGGARRCSPRSQSCCRSDRWARSGSTRSPPERG